MPQTAQWVDEVTRVFGIPKKIIAEENGQKLVWEKNAKQNIKKRS